MNKPILSFATIRHVHDDTKASIKPGSIEKRGDKYFVKQKKIKFLSDLQFQIMFREKPTPEAFFKGIKEQNENFHSEYFDQELKDDIDQMCDQGIKDFGHLKMSELKKIMNLLKLGYSLFNSNNQHIYPILQYGKAHLELDKKRSQTSFDYDECWSYLHELKKQGIKPHKYNISLRKKFGLSEETFKPIVAKFKKTV